MPHPALPSQDDAPASEVILGVDSHKDLHVAAVITALGALLGSRGFAASRAGYEQLLTWARTFGPLQRAGVECTGSHGAALARHLRTEGVQVIEVNQPDKTTRRRRGKTDAIDAETAARAVLTGRAIGSMKTGDGPVEILRMFKLAKASAIKARTQTINQLKAVLIAADPALREAFADLSNPILFRRCAELPPTTPHDVTSAAVYTLRLLAQRIRELTSEIRDLERRITDAVAAHTPASLGRPGIGSDSAAALLVTAGDSQIACAARRLSRPSAASAPCRHPRARPTGDDSTAAATARPTPHSTASHSPACVGTNAAATTSTGAPPKAKPVARPSAASNATSPEKSTS
ncbi:transposase [Amycolatopsis sp. PS_44_ISF1]|nr:transposase [Amycolatopsis sp. PS_44_ISF1]MDT8916017.1 transposase [Amycolatopsis sp. PS_44_ISF1]